VEGHLEVQPQIAVVGAAFASAFAAGVVRSSVGFAVESIEPAVAFVVGEHPEVTSRLLAAAVALPFAAAAAWPTAVAAAFVELAVGSSVGAFVPFAVDVVEAEPLVVTSFAVVVDAEAALEEEEADSSQAVADLAEGAEVAASPVLAAVVVAVVEEEEEVAGS